MNDDTFEHVYGPRNNPAARDGHTGELPAITGPIAPTPPPTDAEREAAAAAHGYLPELADATIPGPVTGTHHDDSDPWDAYPAVTTTFTWADAAAHYIAANLHLDETELRRRARIIIDGGPEALDDYLDELEPDVIAARLRWPMVEVLPSDAGSILDHLSTGRRVKDSQGQDQWVTAAHATPDPDPPVEPSKVHTPGRRRKPALTITKPSAEDIERQEKLEQVAERVRAATPPAEYRPTRRRPSRAASRTPRADTP
jgi:hypothetical protein